MSGNRFDRLTRAVGEAPTRRAALKVLAGATAGALVARALRGTTAEAQSPSQTHLTVTNDTN